MLCLWTLRPLILGSSLIFSQGSIYPPQVPIEHGLLQRCYSLIGPAKVRKRRGYSIAVRHARGVDDMGAPIEGLMSGHIHRALKVGDRIEARMPCGKIYLCGSMDMMKGMTDDLVAASVPRLDIQFEAFRSPQTATITPGQAFGVTFARSELSHIWTSSDGPLLGFAERLGISLPSGYRVGQCESCAANIKKGSVAHLHGEEPETDDTCLACQAIPTSVLTLDA